MNRNICNRYFFRFLSRVYCVNGSSVNHRCFTQFTKPYKLSKDKLTMEAAYMFKIQSCCVSSSNSNLKSNDSAEPNQNVLEDEEFQNILKDFSKDFGLGSDSENILNDIKKSLDESNTVEETTPSSGTDGDLNLSTEKVSAYCAIEETYKEFSDSDSVVIQSFEDIVSGACEEEELIYHIDKSSHTAPLVKPKRGISGVYDIGELVEVLRKENLFDIAVISIPKEKNYADFMVLANAKSPRHNEAVSENVIKLYKMKKHKNDPFIKIEGVAVSNWKVLDMGNIVLHMFLEETRAFYDVESLWLFDSNFDSGGTLKPDPLFDAIQEQLAFFNSLQDSPSKETSKECLKEFT